MPLPIVLDTNIIWTDWRLNKPLFRALIDTVQAVGGEVWLPEIVFDETIKHHKEQVSKAIDDANRALRNFAEMAGREVDIFLTNESAELVNEEYALYLQQKVVSLHGGIWRTDNLPHNLISQWAVARRKPFKKNGIGYQDALIWSTVLELCRIQRNTVMFVTDNASDFYDSDQTTLHPELQADLDALGKCDYPRIRIFRSIAQFVEGLVAPLVMQLSELNKAFSSGLDGEKIKTQLFNFLRDGLQSTVWNASVVGVKTTSTTIRVMDVRTLLHFEVRIPRELDRDEFLLPIDANVGIDFEGFVDHQLWQELRHVPPMHGVDAETFGGSVHFLGSRVVPVELYVSVKKGSSAITGWELVSLGGTLPTQPDEDDL